MNDLSGVHNYRYQVQHDKPRDLAVFLHGFSWLCLIITPWAIIAFIAEQLGLVDLTVTSQIILSFIAAGALPQFGKLGANK